MRSTNNTTRDTGKTSHKNTFQHKKQAYRFFLSLVKSAPFVVFVIAHPDFVTRDEHSDPLMG